MDEVAPIKVEEWAPIEVEEVLGAKIKGWRAQHLDV